MHAVLGYVPHYTFHVPPSQERTKTMVNVKIKTTGMHCSGCAMNMQDFISEVPGVKKVKADFKSGIVEVQYDEKTATLAAIKEAVVKAGYKPE
jgi:copper chaperone